MFSRGGQGEIYIVRFVYAAVMLLPGSSFVAGGVIVSTQARAAMHTYPAVE